MTIAGLEKSFTAAAGPAWATAGETPPGGDGEGCCTGRFSIDIARVLHDCWGKWD